MIGLRGLWERDEKQALPSACFSSRSQSPLTNKLDAVVQGASLHSGLDGARAGLWRGDKSKHSRSGELAQINRRWEYVGNGLIAQKIAQICTFAH